MNENMRAILPGRFDELITFPFRSLFLINK